jgi:hypothetical protein
MAYEPVDSQTAQSLEDAAAQCRRAMQTAGIHPTDEPLGTVVNLEHLIASYPEGHVPNENSVFQFVALLGETVRAAYGGQWVTADVGSGPEFGVVTDGPHGEVFWNLTGKLRRRLQRAGHQDSLTFYWKTISEQMAQ